MRPLTAPELLTVWERGQAQSPPLKALALLAAACPETPPEALARLPVGPRDALLLELRALTFGPRLTAVTACPVCGAALDLAFDVGDIRVEPAVPPGETLSVSAEGYEVAFRLPDSLDLLAVGDGGEEAARHRLLGRCVLRASRNGEQTPAGGLPAGVLAAVLERMAGADPQAEVRLALACPECRHSWEGLFDIVSYFWGEIHHWALRTLRDVHTLAAAYGWREADILALSPPRRQVYLDLVRG